MTAIEVRALRKAFVQHLRDGLAREVLRGVDLDVQPCSSVIVRGPSGSGKSSLLRCVYGTYRVDGGSITVRSGDAEIDVAGADERGVLAARDRLMGFATQFLEVVPRVSARDLVAEEGLEPERALELLEELGLPRELGDAPPATFSGGERQLVNLAITLARPRPILLLDEATASLDHERRRRVFAALRRRKEEGATLVGVFHDMPTDRALVDDVVELRAGKVVATRRERS